MVWNVVDLLRVLEQKKTEIRLGWNKNGVNFPHSSHFGAEASVYLQFSVSKKEKK